MLKILKRKVLSVEPIVFPDSCFPYRMNTYFNFFTRYAHEIKSVKKYDIYHFIDCWHFQECRIIEFWSNGMMECWILSEEIHGVMVLWYMAMEWNDGILNPCEENLGVMVL